MELDDTINRVKELVAARDKIDAELAGIFGGAVPTKRTLTCSRCGEQGHTARSCSKPAET